MNKIIYGAGVFVLVLILSSCGGDKGSPSNDEKQPPEEREEAENQEEAQVRTKCMCEYKVAQIVGGRGSTTVTKPAREVFGAGADEESAEKKALETCKSLIKPQQGAFDPSVTDCEVSAPPTQNST